VGTGRRRWFRSVFLQIRGQAGLWECEGSAGAKNGSEVGKGRLLMRGRVTLYSSYFLRELMRNLGQVLTMGYQKGLT
jgi:hypothetical protein